MSKTAPKDWEKVPPFQLIEARSAERARRSPPEGAVLTGALLRGSPGSGPGSHLRMRVMGGLADGSIRVAEVRWYAAAGNGRKEDRAPALTFGSWQDRKQGSSSCA